MKRSTAKQLANLITTASVGRLGPAFVGLICPPVRVHHRAMNYVAGFAIGGLISKATTKYVDETIDEIYNAIEKFGPAKPATDNA
jgi:hypothetical protein